MRISHVLFAPMLVLLSSSGNGAAIESRDAPSVSFADGSIDLFASEGRIVDWGACSGRTMFYPGLYGQIEVALAVRLNGATSDGISGAELFIDGLENVGNGWICSFESARGALSIGDPCEPYDPGTGVETRRMNVVFEGVSGPLPEDGCQVGDGSLVLLGFLKIWNRGQADLPPMFIDVRPAAPPSLEGVSCALVTLCDWPTFTAVCVSGGSFIVNPPIAAVAPHDPLPPDGATNVPRDVVLRWNWIPPQDCTPTAYHHSMGLATTPNPPPDTFANVDACNPQPRSWCYRPGLLEANTKYYWRGAGGSEWTFTTGEQTAITKNTWSRVKQLFR